MRNPDLPATPRLLILVVAFNDAATLEAVLERIPSCITEIDHRLLIIDDASSDRTFEISCSWGLGKEHIEVLNNPVSQGYGANHKIGLRYAVDHGFDAVAVLHGSGKYDPAELPQLLAPVLEGTADVVLGSRMSSLRSAFASGMPLYKVLGNRVLSRVQNRLLGTRFTELHSGYRVYSTAALRRIPFELNTDDLHFDTEILIQLVRKGLRMVERPISAYSGDEIRAVNGVVYAARVLRTTVLSRLHDLGVLYQPNYELREPEEIYELKLGYRSSHTVALDLVPPGSTVLDLGCGRGRLADRLVERGCTVHGVDAGGWTPPPSMASFTRADLDAEELAFDPRGCDVILLLDIIEHLNPPEALLDRLRRALGPSTPKIVISVPNVAFWPIRLRLLLGSFEYGREGILDLDHARLFTAASLVRVLRQHGFRVLRTHGIPAPFPKALGDTWPARVLLALNQLLIHLSRGLFAYQILVEAEALPTADELLRRSRERASRRRSPEDRAAAGG